MDGRTSPLVFAEVRGGGGGGGGGRGWWGGGPGCFENGNTATTL